VYQFAIVFNRRPHGYAPTSIDEAFAVARELSRDFRDTYVNVCSPLNGRVCVRFLNGNRVNCG
jgi:hypothetical protein